MNRTLAAAEWRRSLQSLAAAQLCHGEGLYADAISRAYYAVMHAAKAALALYDIVPVTHDGVSNRFGEYIVVSGLVERRWGREIAPLAALRRTADYQVETRFGDTDARSAYHCAEAFVGRIRPLLASAIPTEGPGMQHA